MYAQAVRTPPRFQHRGGRRIQSSAFEQCAKGCAFPDVQLDCIKYLKLGDPCMGSGHILVYAFDVLMQIYESAGYSQRDAAKSILENNLYGLDIDDRAFQMAYFAVMMKARQYNRRILSGDCRPNVYSIQESNGIDRDQLKYFGAGLNEFEKNNAITQMNGLLDTFADAKVYGSILKVSEMDWSLLREFVADYDVGDQMSMDVMDIETAQAKLQVLIAQSEVMASKYSVAATNPPYMGISSGSGKLNDFVKRNYPDSKADLFAVFIEQCIRMTKQYGFTAMITMHAWMFLSSFEKLRMKLQTVDIVNMAHLGARAFEEIGGEVVQTTSFSIRRTNITSYTGCYKRLVFEPSQELKKTAFHNASLTYIASWKDFNRIPGKPIVYWASEGIYDAFQKASLCQTGKIAQGLITGSTMRFTRLWYEVNYCKFFPYATTGEEIVRRNAKWVPYNKGGEYRKWYGNNDYVVNWENNGYEIKHFFDENGKLCSRPQGSAYYFRDVITWTKISTAKISFRHKPAGHISSEAGMTIYLPNKNSHYVMGFCNSVVAQEILHMLSPTLNYELGDIGKLPLIESNQERVCKIVSSAESLAMVDWDSFETSWDFKRHPLVEYCHSVSKAEIEPDWSHLSYMLRSAYEAWKYQCDLRFATLKKNEEELNQIFIEIYGLQDELSPGVEDKDVTVRRANLQREIKSLLSYSVGCMFGRYSLDVDGIAYAGGDWDESKYISFIPDKDNVIPITDEEYLEDDIVSRLCSWLKTVYGEATLEENLDFIAKALGSKGDSSREVIRNYFLNDFFKDHCQTYSVTGSGKRPIYWLFDSGKQNGFKALIYLHRYNADTIGNLRVDYLHRMQRIYENEISRMQDMIDHSTNAREVAQATKRREKLTKQLKECREYDEKLAHLALSRIELDLDDGVKKNYRKIQTANDGKFYEVLADSKNIMAKE